MTPSVTTSRQPGMSVVIRGRLSAAPSSNMPGCREVVTDSVNGLLVPARNGPRLGTAILELLDDPARCRDMGRASRTLVEERFHLEMVAASYADIYHRVLGTAKPAEVDLRQTA